MIIKKRFTSLRVWFSLSHCHSSHSLCRTKATTTLLLSTTCWSSDSRPIVAASPWNSGSTPASDDQAPLLNRQLSRCVRRFQRLLEKHIHPRFSDQSSSIQGCKKRQAEEAETFHSLILAFIYMIYSFLLFQLSPPSAFYIFNLDN